jgi:hypothetical protein
MARERYDDETDRIHTCHRYAFALGYEIVGIAVIRFAGEEVSINFGRGVCLIIILGLQVMRGKVQRRNEAACSELDGS